MVPVHADVPVVLGRLHRTARALLIAGVDADAQGLVGVGEAEDTGYFRGDAVLEGCDRSETALTPALATMPS